MSIVFAIASPESAKLFYVLLMAIVSGAVTVIVLVIKNWCKLLSGTYAVMHDDEQRRADARLVYERTLDNEVERDDDPPQVEGPPQPPDQRPLGRGRPCASEFVNQDRFEIPNQLRLC